MSEKCDRTIYTDAFERLSQTAWHGIETCLEENCTRRSLMKKPKKKPSPPAKARNLAPRNLTPGLCERLQRDLLAACREVAQSHGLDVEGGELSDIDLRHGFDISFHVGIPLPDGSLYSPDKAIFEALAPQFGLEPSDYGRMFKSNGEAFRITAINPNRPKYPVSAERIADGRGYKFAADNVRQFLLSTDAL